MGCNDIHKKGVEAGAIMSDAPLRLGYAAAFRRHHGCFSMRQWPIRIICRWCGDVRARGADCARDDELRSSCDCGPGADVLSADLPADFDAFTAIVRRLEGRAGKRD